MRVHIFRKRPCKNRGIGNCNNDQNAEMNQVHFRGNVRIIGKGTERVDRRMDEDAEEQAATAIKNRDQQEAHCNGKDDLTQVAQKIHAAAVEQVYDMSDAEGQAGNDDGRFHIVLCDGCEQQAAENHFLQKSDAEHTHNPAGRFCRTVIDRNAIPEISRCQDNQRQIIEKSPCRNKGMADSLSVGHISPRSE